MTTWQAKAESLAKDYFKKTKAKGASLIVLSIYGDLVFKSGKPINFDATSLGSLSASLLAAADALAKDLKGSSRPLQFGMDSKAFWMDRMGDQWIILGVKCPAHEKHLKAFMKQLQKVLASSGRKKTSEALDGLSEAGIDSHLDANMTGKNS